MSVMTLPEVIVCKYRRSLDALRADPAFDEDDAAQVADWVSVHTPATHIARTLRDAGYRVSATVIKDHRRGDCACRVDV